MMESIRFTHSPPGYQALNPVECAVRQLYYLMNFYLEQGHLSALCWYDMAEAAAYVMNRLPHPQSKDPRRQVSSAYELVTNKRPDISDLIAAPGELVVVDSLGAKASAGRPTGTQCYYIRPCGAHHIVRSFKTGLRMNTKSVRTITDPSALASTLVSLRHALHTGHFRDGSGLSGASAAAVASGCVSLLADAVRNGGSDDLDHYFALLDPVSGHPSRLVQARVEGVNAFVEHSRTKPRHARRRGLSDRSPPVPSDVPSQSGGSASASAVPGATATQATLTPDPSALSTHAAAPPVPTASPVVRAPKGSQASGGQTARCSRFQELA